MTSVVDFHMKHWRLIEYSKESASYNMALDETIANSVIKNISPPTLRFYGWSSPSVTIGTFQKIYDIDIDYCRGKNIHVVRRPTGGRAILHDNELTYSFASTIFNSHFRNSLLKNYSLISNAFYTAMLKLGLDAEVSKKRQRRVAFSRSPLCFESTSYGEITINGVKIIGAAQKRYKEGFLQQGSIPFLINRLLISNVLRKFNGVNKLSGLKEIIQNINRDNLIVAIKGAFEEVFNIRFVMSGLVDEERDDLKRLEKKYQSADWLYRR